MMVKRTLGELTREEFLSVPHRENWAEPVKCNSLVIIGMEEKHDSGYRCIRAVACMDNEPICAVTAYSDVINIEGIGGFGRNTGHRDKIFPAGFSIDCLPESGLFRIFCSNDTRIMICGAALSNFELFSDSNYNKKGRV